MRKLIYRAAALALCLSVMSGCAAGNKEAAEPASEAVSDSQQTQSEEQAASAESEAVEIPIDFAEWKKINPDVYAWITVPNTNIDYPVLQSDENTDPDYYLEYCIDKTKGRPGAIYSERNYNTKTFEDFVTILYGHDMWTDGTYFHELHRLEDKTFFDENRQITIYTPDARLDYTIFAVFNYDDRHLMMSNYGFTMIEDKTSFLEEVFDIRDISANIDQTMKEQAMDPESRILILSTCNQISSDQRYLVLAVLD